MQVIVIAWKDKCPHAHGMPHPFSQNCAYCGSLTEAEQYDFDRRVEHVTVVRHDGKPVNQINVKVSENLHAFCSRACWESLEPTLVEELEVQTTYPPFGFVTSCCRCGASVDRTHDYVCYIIAAMSYSADGSPFAECTGERVWIVLCHSCEGPDAPEAASVAKDIDVLERELL